MALTSAEWTLRIIASRMESSIDSSRGDEWQTLGFTQPQPAHLRVVAPNEPMRCCVRCQEPKPLRYEFHRMGRGSIRRYDCRECVNARRRKVAG